MSFSFLKTLAVVLLISTRVFAASSLTEGMLVRDAEIEAVLKSYIEPLFKAAGLDPKSLHLYVIYSKAINAMAMGGGRIGIHTALIQKATSASQVIGVLAHETAHLADHHVTRGGEAMEKALLQSLLGTLGGVAVGVLGKNADAASAIIMGSQDVALRGLLKFSRTQEGSADQGAARLLDKLHWPSRGMLEFMETLNKEDFLSNRQLDPYLLTHPLFQERLDFFRTHVNKSLYANAPLPEPFEKDFERIQVKISAFTESLAKTLSRFKPTDDSVNARYARAIAYFQASQEREALEEIESLLREFPQDVFFWDLKGQILFESGKIREAVHSYEKAVSLRPDIPLFHLSLAHALIETGDAALLERAYSELLRVKTEESDNPFTYHLLAIYYGKKGKTGLAALSLSEMAMEVGDLEQAEQQVKRALHLLKGDIKNHQRAVEISEEIEKLKKQAKNWMGI